MVISPNFSSFLCETQAFFLSHLIILKGEEKMVTVSLCVFKDYFLIAHILEDVDRVFGGNMKTISQSVLFFLILGIILVILLDCYIL